MTNQPKYQIGLLIYPGMTQLDLTGPYQVFALMPDAQVHLVWKNLEPVTSNDGLTILPTSTFDPCPRLDVICVPGGPGHCQMIQDAEVLKFLQQQGGMAKYITSVCTGSLILAAAGLLQGYRAACHWAFRDQLAILGVEVGSERVVVDRNRITGGGITAGIDFGLLLAGKLVGEDTAKMLQLLMEYNPAPPFATGSPAQAGAVLTEQAKQFRAPLIEASRQTIQEIAAQLGTHPRSISA